MAIDIVVYNDNIANSAPTSYWGELEAALRLDPAFNNKQVTVYLNENGEYENFSTSSIANEIYNGAIWIDWCGWPFFFNNASAVLSGLTLGISPGSGDPYRFGDLMSEFGFQMGYGGDSYPSFSQVPSGFPYLRSLVVSEKPQNPGFIKNPNAPNWISGNTYTYSSFAVRHGQGAYIYACGLAHPITEPFDPFATDVGPTPNSVTPQMFIPFVKQIINDILGNGLAASSAPTFGGQYGTFVRETSNGQYIYMQTINGVVYNHYVDPAGTLLYSITLNTAHAGSTPSASAGSASSGGYVRGKCPIGIYMGNGAVVGANPKYDAYMFALPTGYNYYLVDPNSVTPCTILFKYFHAHTITPPPTGSSSGGSSTAKSGSGGTVTRPPATSPSATASGGTLTGLLSNKTVLTLGAVGIVGAIGYWYWRRQHS